MLKRPSLLGIVVLVVFGCGGGGGSGGGTGTFEILSTNLSPNQTFPINAPIEVRFSKPVDLATVNFSTFSIVAAPPATVGPPVAGPVQGLFFAKSGTDEETVVFQPSCPTDASNSNGGFVPGNAFGSVVYTLTMRGGSYQGQVLRAQDGSALNKSFTVSFQTPAPPVHPFVDPKPGSPPRVVDLASLPAVLPLNLLIHPMPSLRITLDQPVLSSSIDDQSIRLEYLHPVSGQTAGIPVKVTLIENCNAEQRAVLSVLPLGVLPPDQLVHFILSKQVKGLGLDDANPADVEFYAVAVESVHGQPQQDAMLEEFDSQAQMDPSAPLLVPLARWGSGRLESAPMYPGFPSNVQIEIGPGTTNGKTVVFSTDGGVLKDVNGTPIAFSNGIIDVAKFTIKNGGSPTSPSRFQGNGSNPLIIRCSQQFLVELNAEISVDGQKGADESGVCTANITVPGGTGTCGGGNGGSGSANPTGSTQRGSDGNGPFNILGMGGKGGRSGYGFAAVCGSFSTNFYNTRPGGGGGGNWGVTELNAGVPGTFCFSVNASPCFFPKTSPNFGCPQPLSVCPAASQPPASNCDHPGNPTKPNNSFGENGASGPSTSKDALTGVAPALGGAAGIPIFVDGNESNNFLGRKPSGSGVIQGELNSILGGEGGGGGGDGIGSTVFPSQDFLNTDMSGAGGGGGGGVLWVQCLGPLIVRGTMNANGGGGGEGEQISNLDGTGSGGGGGGAGGMILLESPTSITIGLNAVISARGGQRGLGSGTVPTPVPPFPAGGPTAGCFFGITNPTASHGGAGGKGVVAFMTRFSSSLFVDCDGAAPLDHQIEPGAVIVETSGGGAANILCERDPILTAKVDPDPHVLILNYGPQSGARSQWFYTGQANTAGSLAYSFGGVDGSGLINGAPDPVLVAGSGGVVSLQSNAVTLDNASLANLVRSEPRVLIGDDFVPSASSGRFSIVNAEVSGNQVTLFTEASAGALPAVGSWKVLRRFFATSVDGQVSAYPSGATARILFEAANELSPAGSMIPDPATISGPTANIQDPGIAGKQMLRFTVLFDRNALQSFPLNPLSPSPGIFFWKAPYSF